MAKKQTIELPDLWDEGETKTNTELPDLWGDEPVKKKDDGEPKERVGISLSQDVIHEAFSQNDLFQPYTTKTQNTPSGIITGKLESLKNDVNEATFEQDFADIQNPKKEIVDYESKFKDTTFFKPVTTEVNNYSKDKAFSKIEAVQDAFNKPGMEDELEYRKYLVGMDKDVDKEIRDVTSSIEETYYKKGFSSPRRKVYELMKDISPLKEQLDSGAITQEKYEGAFASKLQELGLKLTGDGEIGFFENEIELYNNIAEKETEKYLKSLEGREQDPFAKDVLEKLSAGGGRLLATPYNALATVEGITNLVLPENMESDSWQELATRLNKLNDQMSKQGDRYNQSITESIKNGDYASATGGIALGISENIPMLITLAMGNAVGASNLSLGVLGTQTGAEEYVRLTEEGYPEFTKFINSFLKASAEIIPDKLITMKILDKAREASKVVGIDNLKGEVERQLKLALQDGVGRMYDITKPGRQEAISEIVTEELNGITDYITGVSEEYKPFSEATFDAGLVGFFTGESIAASGGIRQATDGTKKRNKKLMSTIPKDLLPEDQLELLRLKITKEELRKLDRFDDAESLNKKITDLENKSILNKDNDIEQTDTDAQAPTENKLKTAKEIGIPTTVKRSGDIIDGKAHFAIDDKNIIIENTPKEDLVEYSIDPEAKIADVSDDVVVDNLKAKALENAKTDKEIDFINKWDPKSDEAADAKINQPIYDAAEELGYDGITQYDLNDAVSNQKPTSINIFNTDAVVKAPNKERQEVIDEIAEKGEDLDEIYNLYNEETPEINLPPWQEELLGRKIDRDSFIRYGDKNDISQTLALSWFSKKGAGEKIDSIVSEIENVYGVELTPDQVVDFIKTNPTNRLKTTSPNQIKLAKRYKEVSNKSIKHHVVPKDIEKGLTDFLNKYDPYAFSFEDMRNAVESNKDKLTETQYKQYITEIETSQNESNKTEDELFGETSISVPEQSQTKTEKEVNYEEKVQTQGQKTLQTEDAKERQEVLEEEPPETNAPIEQSDVSGETQASNEVLFDYAGESGIIGNIESETEDSYKVRSNDGTVYTVKKTDENIVTDPIKIKEYKDNKAKEIEKNVSDELTKKIGKLNDKQNKIKDDLVERLQRISGVKKLTGDGESKGFIEDAIGIVRDLGELGLIQLEKGSLVVTDTARKWFESKGVKVTDEQAEELNERLKEEFEISDFGKKDIAEQPEPIENIEEEFPLMTRFEKGRRAFEDRFLRVKTFQDYLLKGKDVKESQDFETNIRLMTSAARHKYETKANEIIKSKPKSKTKSLVEELTSLKVSLDDFGKYLWSLHAEERNTKVKRRNNEKVNKLIADKQESLDNLDRDNFDSEEKYDAKTKLLRKQISELEKQLITEDQVFDLNKKANDYKKRVEESSKGEELKRLADRFNKELPQSVLEELKESGLIDEADVQNLSDYKNYAPYKRMSEAQQDLKQQETNVSISPESTSNIQVKGKDLYGANNLLDIDATDRVNPLIQAFYDYRNAVVRSSKNKSLESFAELVEENPNDYVKVIKPRYRVEKDVNGNIEYVYRDSRYAPANNNNYIEFKRNGKPELIEITDPDLLRAIRGTGVLQHEFFRQFGKINNYLRGVITVYNPDFIIPNFAKDVQTAVANISAEEIEGIRRKLVKNVLPAARGVWQNDRGNLDTEWSQITEELKDLGGEIGWMDLNDISNTTKRIESQFNRYNSTKSTDAFINGLENTLSYIESLNKSIEMATRVATYKAAIDSGMNKKKAAKLAKNITVNFEKKGELGSAMNSLYLFSNAGIQGTVNILKAVYRSPKAQRVAGAIMVAGFMESYLASVLAPDWYEQIPEYEKERNFIIPRPDGKYFKIPLPYGYNVFKYAGNVAFSTATNRMGQWEGAKNLYISMASAFNPLGSGELNLVPTMGKTVIEMRLNRNWAGAPLKPIKSPFADEKPESQKYFSSVSKPSKWVAESINEWTGGNVYESGGVDISPEMFDHAFNFMVGGTGRFMSSLYKTTKSAIKGEEIKGEHLPIARRFMGSTSDRELLSTVYDMRSESARTNYSDEQISKFTNALVKSLKKGVINREQAKNMANDFIDNQVKIKSLSGNPDTAKKVKEIEELKKLMK